ncbi:hypothetical protein CTAYLR_007267 [Chrysophaeum taylorii]|uniref:Uncharacterized protein n=1 Tax=Chrysophaeum taylorii TaxID=2483200 RepID=A0AAD7UKD1_9STRA|nr:hypothetical protein CTAYLR_007267 [Chrysophaeum taylorii]
MSFGEVPAYRVQTLNTLAFPKGQVPRCEMTGLPARVQCITPHITLYFVSKECAKQAWYGIMHKIAPLLGPLRTPCLVVGTEEDRAKREYTMEMSKKALVDLCSQEAEKFLVERQYDLAIPGALQAVTFLREIYGDGAIEMIGPFMQLAEAHLGLGRAREAAEVLGRATWTVSKNPDCSNSMKSQLHRNIGKLHLSQNKLDEALAELSHDIYFSSLEMGPEHIETSVGYYHIASVFYAQHKIENALAFYDKVVDIWYRFLLAARRDTNLVDSVSESQLSQAGDMLDHVLRTRAKLLGDTHIATGEAKYTVGLLHLVANNVEKARDAIQAALATYIDHLGPDHPSTKHIQDTHDACPLPKAPPGQVIAFGDDADDADAAGDTLHGHTFGAIDAHFPSQMPRAATQSPIPLVPEGAGL